MGAEYNHIDLLTLLTNVNLSEKRLPIISETVQKWADAAVQG